MTKLWRDPETGVRPALIAWLMAGAVAAIVAGFFYFMTFVDYASDF